MVGGREEAGPVPGSLQRSPRLRRPPWVSQAGRSWYSVEEKIEGRPGAL